MSDSMRSINSFGVAGLLSQSCDIFYSNDLRGRNIGRVSDLVSAQLREFDADELRIRALLVYGVFQSYAVRGLKHHHQEDLPPTSVEIGIDNEYIAVAVSFHWDASRQPKWKGLAERVDGGLGGDPFEKMLEWIYRHSTQVLVRYEVKERRVEVVSLLNRVNAELRDPTMVVSVDSSTAPLLEVSNYIELGDLNFTKLLKTPDFTETKVDGRTPQDSLEEINVKGGESSAEEIRKFSGSKTGDLSETRISEKSKSDEDALSAIREEYESTVSELKNTIHELKERLEAAENAASERRFNSASSDEDETTILVKGEEKAKEDKDDEWGLHFLKQVWPFAPKAAEKGPEGVVESPEANVATADSQESTEGGDTIEVTESERAAEQALSDLHDLAKTKKSKKVEATLQEIEEEVEPNKAKRWVESLSSELLLEKARLAELQKNLAKQLRQRELEFKTSERALKLELKRKEELISQRQASIENKNDQIAQLNLAVERATAGSNDKESQQVKMKLDRAQRLAQMKEEEAKALGVKVRDLENRLIIAQAKSQKGNDLQVTVKVQGLEKKVDEYKRINQRLMESLNSQKEKSNDKEVGDLRRKIDQLDRLVSDSKRNLDKSAFKLRELQESERKLQLDLARVVEENRNLRKPTARGGGESGGQAA